MAANLLACLSDNVSADKSKCIGCGECMEHCILDNIRLQQAPCYAACPLGINPQGYVQHTARGEIPQALEQLYKRTPFIGILGSVCSHVCEGQCNRNKLDEQAVMIRSIKRYLYDRRGENLPNLEKSPLKPQQVAVVGGGPAGLSAAFDLLKEGYGVSIFEAASALGGMLYQAIPAFRMEDCVLETETDLLRQMGADIRCGQKVDAAQFQQIVERYDAVFVATGLGSGLALPGLQAENVLEALPYLQKAKRATWPLGGRVVVIGGGDVAVDAALTAKRDGAEQVSLVCLEGEDSMPASDEMVAQAKAEGVVFVCAYGLKQADIVGGKVRELLFKRCLAVLDENRKFCPSFAEEETLTLGCDAVVVAIGQKADLGYLAGAGVEHGGQVKVHPLSLQTSNPKIFAGGDIIEGVKNVVSAMADGKAVAESIHRYLQQDDLVFGRAQDNRYLHEFEAELSSEEMGKRAQLSQTLGEGMLERTLTDAEAAQQAHRCLNCGGPVGYRRTCWMCLPCEVVCPCKALHIKVHYSLS